MRNIRFNLCFPRKLVMFFEVVLDNFEVFFISFLEGCVEEREFGVRTSVHDAVDTTFQKFLKVTRKDVS